MITIRFDNALLVSISLGVSLDRIISRVENLVVIAGSYLRSAVSVSSPEILRRRSTTIELSVRPLSLASEIMAKDLPINGAKPKLVARLDNVGPTTFVS